MLESNPPRKSWEDIKIFDGAIDMSIYGINEVESDDGLTLRNLKKEGDELKPENKKLVEILLRKARETGISEILAPVAVPPNGEVYLGDDYTDKIILGKNKVGEDIVLRRGVNFEGCELKHGQAFIVSPADCYTVAAKSGDRVLVGHAGRDSLHDAKNPDRPGIVENMVRELGPDTKIWGGYGIAGDDFVHSSEDPKFGELNRKRQEDLFASGTITKNEGVDLANLIVHQTEKAGGSRENVIIDKSVSTFSDTDENGRPVYFSNRRLGPQKMGRNLVWVSRSI
jgi:hypothetical protein